MIERSGGDDGQLDPDGGCRLGGGSDGAIATRDRDAPNARRSQVADPLGDGRCLDLRRLDRERGIARGLERLPRARRRPVDEKRKPGRRQGRAGGVPARMRSSVSPSLLSSNGFSRMMHRVR